MVDALGQGRYTEALVTFAPSYSDRSFLPDVRGDWQVPVGPSEWLMAVAPAVAADLIEEADQYTQPNRSDHRALPMHRVSDDPKNRRRSDPPCRYRRTAWPRPQDIGQIGHQNRRSRVSDEVCPHGLARFALEPEDTRAIGFISPTGRPQNAMTYFWHYLKRTLPIHL